MALAEASEDPKEVGQLGRTTEELNRPLPLHDPCFFGPILQLTRKRRSLTAKYFTEALGEDVGLDMILVPGGTFTMGSPKDEPKRQDNEGPQHEVKVQDFLLGRYPVTQTQWRAVAALEQVERELKADPSEFKGDDRPVELVSWEDVQEFCARLSREMGRGYRSPSEAEWEYACRAGTKTPFYYGKTLVDDLANYRATFTYDGGPKGKYRKETTPVGSFPANEFGLCDMHGNVLEWCQDRYHDSYKGAPVDGTAWEEGDNSKQLRILRGGSWIDGPWSCRSAFRYWGSPSNRRSFIGFRVACVAPRAV